MIRISFTWDDGAPEDLRLIDLSEKYRIPSMFFIPATNSEHKILAQQDIKKIGQSFEIGAHTYSHKRLNLLSNVEASHEMERGKDFLEQLLGRNIEHFCFPGGKFNNYHIKIAKRFFASARTADTGAVVRGNSFLIKPAFHFFDRGFKSLIYNSLRNLSPHFPLLIKESGRLEYFELIKAVISGLHSGPGVSDIVIWGHSWEIEEYGLWKSLEDVFKWLDENCPESIIKYSEMIESHKELR